METRRKVRVHEASKRLPHSRSAVPQIVFSTCTKKEAIVASFIKARKALQNIMDGDLSAIPYLAQHMSFMENSKLCEEFFSLIPFNLFIDQIHLDNAYSLESLKICSQCISSAFCPPDFLSLISSSSELAEFLFSTILPKYGFSSSISCFKFFSVMVLFSCEIRDFLLNSNIIQVIYDISKDKKILERSRRFFLIEASNFIFNCMISNPISDQSLLNDVYQAYFFFLNNDDKFIVVQSIKLFKKMGKIDQFDSFYPDILEKSFEFIYENYINTESFEVALSVYSLLKEIDSLEYLQLTLSNLQNFNSPKMTKKCLKEMSRRNEEWSLIDNETICQILINIAEASSFIIQKLAMKVLILYWDRSRMITGDFMNLLLNFINDKEIGIICINTIYSFLSDSFTQDEIESFVSDYWNESIESTICDIIDNGNDDESEAASLLLNSIHNFCS